MKICQNPNCKKEFEPGSHNAKYCTPECRRAVTNKRVLANYHANKNRKVEDRVCQTCDSHLSRYNKKDICELCQSKLLMTKASKTGISKALVEEMYDISRRD